MGYLEIEEEVQEALDKREPVVTLESTIISHGFPYPLNVQLAYDVEKSIREEGVVPATIAIINGKIHIGLSEKEFELLGESSETFKTSVYGIPNVLATKKIGATTVAATIYVASQFDIRFFATGGLGGERRGVNESFLV